MQPTAGNGDAAVRRSGKGIRPAAEAALVAAAGSIQTVIRGNHADGAAGDLHRLSLNALIAFGHIHRAAADQHRAVRMDAVIPGGDVQRTAGHRHAAIGVQGIVRAVQRIVPIADQQRCTGLQPLGAGIIRQPGAAAAAGADGVAAAECRQCRLRLDAILTGSQRQRSILHRHKAEGTVAVIGGAQRVAPAAYRKGRPLHHTAILTVHAVVLGVHRQGGILQLQGILTGYAIIIVGIDRQAATAGNHKIRLGIEAGIRLLLLRGGIRIREGIAAAVGQAALRSLRQPHGHTGRLIDIQRAAGGAGDGSILQHQRDLLLWRVDHNAAVGQRAAEHIHSTGRDDHAVLLRLCAAAGNHCAGRGHSHRGGAAGIRRGRMAVQHGLCRYAQRLRCIRHRGGDIRPTAAFTQQTAQQRCTQQHRSCPTGSFLHGKAPFVVFGHSVYRQAKAKLKATL